MTHIWIQLTKESVGGEPSIILVLSSETAVKKDPELITVPVVLLLTIN